MVLPCAVSQRRRHAHFSALRRIAAEATASTKSSVTYAYVRDRLAGAPGAPAKGYKTTFRAVRARVLDVGLNPTRRSKSRPVVS